MTKPSRWVTLGVLVGLFLISFFLRAYQPASWTDDKLVRAIRFVRALSKGNWAGTYQQPHPGVTTLAASGLTVRLYQALVGTPARMLFDWAIPPYVTEFGQWMVLGVFGLAVVLAVLIIAIALTLHRLAGWPLALTAAGLLTFSPYFLAQSRVVQVDALLSAFMLLSALLLLTSLQTGQRRYLLLSGIAGGLALLTKTPAVFLAPFTGLALLAHLVVKVHSARANHAEGRAHWLLDEAWRSLVLPGLLWGLMVVLPFALWPAMWVTPIPVLHKVIARTATHMTSPDPQSIFFAGRLYSNTDPIILFYPVTIAFKTTFPTLTLSLVALGHYTLWHRRLRLPLQPLVFWLLVAYVFFFTLQMSIGGKLYARYVLPTHLAIELLAAAGLVGLIDLLQRALSSHYASLARALPSLLVGLAVGLQALVALPFAPDYGAHHNYLLGGNRVAVKMIDVTERNEGMLYVGQFLSRQPDLASQRLVTWFPLFGSATQYFPGKIEKGAPSSEGDYYLFGLATMQRQHHPEDWAATWEAYRDQRPQVVVSFDGVEYLWLYAARPAEPDQHVAVRRGLPGGVALAWTWTAGLALTLAWTLRHAPKPTSKSPDFTEAQ